MLFHCRSLKQLHHSHDSRYGTSKLLLYTAARHLARLSPVNSDSDVILNVCSPGACSTDIFRDEASWIQKIMMKVMVGMIARSSEVGSRELIHAVMPELEKDAHGQFLWNCKISRLVKYTEMLDHTYSHNQCRSSLRRREKRRDFEQIYRRAVGAS